jgi:hypothetical protein
MSAPVRSKWQQRVARVVRRLTGKYHSLKQFAHANVDAIENALEGKGPDAKAPDPLAGVRAVVNIASVHVPNFCERSRTHPKQAYLNSYDLKKSNVRVGGAPPDKYWSNREVVDDALAPIHGHAMNEVYFAAAELNGAGIRFYGDICLVLQPAEIAAVTAVLDRNSYDVLRAPFRDAVDRFDSAADQQAARQHILEALSGSFRPDLRTMGAVKVLVTTGERDRRFSTGQISTGILDDEDYIEILKIGSFDVDGIETVRLSAAEAALESHVDQRVQGSPAAAHSMNLWLMDRRMAVRALADAGLDITVIATSGRVKG